MSDVERPESRAAPVDGAEIAAQVLSGAAATGAGLMLGPPGAVVGAIAAPFFEASLVSIFSRLGPWIERVSHRSLELNGRTAEELADRLNNHPPTAALLVDGAWACGRTESELKIETISRVIAEGLLYEDDVQFDTEAHVARVICKLDKNHVAALAVVSRHPWGSEVSLLCDLLPRLSDIIPSLVNELGHLGLLHRVDVPPPLESQDLLFHDTRAGAAAGRRRDSARDSRQRLPTQTAQISSLGIRVLREFAISAITIEQPLDLGLSKLEFSEDYREYVGMVIPPTQGWGNNAVGASKISNRTIWLHSGRTCETCGSPLINRANLTHNLKGGPSVQILPPNVICPQGPVHRETPN